MPRSNQKTVTLPRRMYDEVQRLVTEHGEDFDGVTDYVKHAIVELNLRIRTVPTSN